MRNLVLISMILFINISNGQDSTLHISNPTDSGSNLNNIDDRMNTSLSEDKIEGNTIEKKTDTNHTIESKEMDSAEKPEVVESLALPEETKEVNVNTIAPNKCNPPCPKRFKCDSIVSDCVPDSTVCKDGETFLNWRCVNLKRVKRGGLELFILANLFFIPGTIYNAITSYKSLEDAITPTEVWDYSSDKYVPDGYYYYDPFYALRLGPPATGYTLGGALLLGANSIQSKYLQKLGEKKLTAFNASGAVLYGLSIGSNTWNFLMLILGDINNAKLVNASSYTNIAILASSLVVNNLSYLLQKSRLIKFVRKHDSALRNNVKFIPYIYCDRKAGNAGFAIRF